MSFETHTEIAMRHAVVALVLCAASLAAKDEIGPLELTPVEEKKGDKGNTILIMKHKAVVGMDSPGHVKDGYEYHVSFGVPSDYKPDDKTPRPAILYLHGFGDKWQQIAPAANWFPEFFVIIPNDPLGTWFYGYSDQLPGGDPTGCGGLRLLSPDR